MLQIFNQHPQLVGVDFIFLTAKTERTDLRRSMELGANDYLTKHFGSSKLLSAVAGRLSRFQHLRPDYDLASRPAPTTDRKPHAVPRRQLLYAEGDEFVHLYFVQAGRVKTSKTTAEGKEFSTGFY